MSCAHIGNSIHPVQPPPSGGFPSPIDRHQSNGTPAKKHHERSRIRILRVHDRGIQFPQQVTKGPPGLEMLPRQEPPNGVMPDIGVPRQIDFDLSTTADIEYLHAVSALGEHTRRPERIQFGSPTIQTGEHQDDSRSLARIGHLPTHQQIPL